MLLLAVTAWAAGFHYLRVEAVGGTTDTLGAEGGVGVSGWSDLLHGWVLFGAPGAEGNPVRQAWVESRWVGPVLGVVPPRFAEIVRSPRLPWLLPWGYVRVGSDADAGKWAEVAANQLVVLNPSGWSDVDPRRAYAGPAVGLGLDADWWRDWRGVPDATVMTGRLSGQAGVLAGVTVRDTWYAQARVLARTAIFGEHVWRADAVAVTGVFLDRVGVPVGLEVTGEVADGDDNVTGHRRLTWGARAALYWKLVPPYQTRIEEEVERRAAGEAAR